MGAPRAIILMYHRLGVPLLPDEKDYALSRDLFESHLHEIAQARREVVSLAAIGEGTFADGSVAVTFDDGYESDALAAAPLLRARGWGGAFFVSALKVGGAGYASWPQLRGMADSGFLVGSHGLDHSLLDDLPEVEVRRQVIESKARIEEALGRSVHAFALPGGSGGERARRIAFEAGYSQVLGSRPGLIRGRPGSSILPRMAKRRHLKMEKFRGLLACRPLGMLGRSLRYRALARVRRILGDNSYARLRQIWWNLPFQDDD